MNTQAVAVTGLMWKRDHLGLILHELGFSAVVWSALHSGMAFFEGPLYGVSPLLQCQRWRCLLASENAINFCLT